jgi:hypothetical protein
MMQSVSTAPPVPTERVTVDEVTYEVAEARTVLDIDRDLPWHSGRWPMESWFIVSNLDCDGQRIVLQLQFQIQTAPTGIEVMQLNVVAVNETAGISRNFEYLYPREQVELSADRMHISTSELTFSGDRTGCAVSVRAKGARIDLTATATAPPLLMNGQGQFFFIALDEQYEFALPAMPTSGTVVIDTVTYQVTGTSWLDRQWGGLPGFFARGLGDSAQAPPGPRGSPQGDELDLDQPLTVEVPYKEQEIVSDIDILTKFEGTATVTGTYQGQQVTGTAFLELVGDWS